MKTRTKIDGGSQFKIDFLKSLLISSSCLVHIIEHLIFLKDRIGKGGVSSSSLRIIY